ncbi:MAG: DNA-processing protein DprA [Burkholderiaceae bacterium]
MATPSPNPSDLTPADDHGAWLRLALSPGLTHAQRLGLLQALGPPGAWIDGGTAAIARLVGQPAALALARPDTPVCEAVEAALRWRDQPGCHLLTLADPDYPKPLLDLADAPLLLYVRGHSLAAFRLPGLAIVGSRHATEAGKGIARSFARSLAAHGLSIISGLAQGIDAAAHEGALAAEAGLTIAVMGTGIDRVYPAAHRDLAHRITDHGVLISELPLGAGPLRNHFPRRNRLIAALGIGVLVVEAARQSGSLITARQAGETGREVFAVPGSIHSPVSRGCHQLIRQGAKLVESAEDVLEELPSVGIQVRGGGAEGPPKEATHLPTDTARELLETIGWSPVSVDSLLSSTPLSHAQLAESLLELELSGLIEKLADGRLVRTGAGATP